MATLAPQSASALTFDVIYTFDGNLAPTETADADNLVQFSNISGGGGTTVSASNPAFVNSLVATYPDPNAASVGPNFFSFTITPQTPTSSVSVTDLFFDILIPFGDFGSQVTIAVSNDNFATNQIIFDQFFAGGTGGAGFNPTNLNTVAPAILNDQFLGVAQPIEFRFYASSAGAITFPGARVYDNIRVRGVPFEFEGGLGLAALGSIGGFALWRKRRSNDSVFIKAE